MSECVCVCVGGGGLILAFLCGKTKNMESWGRGVDNRSGGKTVRIR